MGFLLAAPFDNQLPSAGAVFVAQYDLEGRNARPDRRLVPVPRCRQRSESGLPPLFIQQTLEVSVDVRQDGLPRPEVGRDADDGCRVALRKRVPGGEVRLHVRAAEPVNRLFGVAHQEERARTNLAILPRPHGIPLTGQAPDDFRLQRVCILEFIHEDVRVAPGKGPSHRFVVPQQVPGLVQQVVEIEQRRIALVFTVELPDRIEFGNESVNRQS